MENRKKHVLAALGALAIVGAATTGVLISGSTTAEAGTETVVVSTSTAGTSTAGTSTTGTSTTGSTGDDLSSGSIIINSASPSSDASEPAASPESTASSEATTAAVEDSSAYADGTYTATGNYSTPGGSESVDVTVTLTDDVVTAVEVTGSATSGNSAEYQEDFISGYSGEVLGKALDDVSLSRVAGSSLTSTGFNDAIEQIKTDAVS